MPKIVLTNTCGPYETNTDWTQDFVETMAAEAVARGGNPLTYDEKMVEWRKWNRAAGSGTTAYINSKDWIIRVGNAPTLSIGETPDRSVNNAYSFTIPELVGYTISSVRIGGQTVNPETDGYMWDVSSGTFSSANEMFNINVYFTSRTVSAMPTEGGGSIVLTVPADGVDSITSPLLVGKTITAYTHGNITSNKGFDKPESSDTFALTDGNLLYSDAPLTLFF